MTWWQLVEIMTDAIPADWEEMTHRRQMEHLAQCLIKEGLRQDRDYPVQRVQDVPDTPLRDQYAMAALPALIASYQVLLDSAENMSAIVQDAFTFADLCMEERDK